MIRELEKILAEIEPGAPVKPEHFYVLVAALLPILKMEGRQGIKITKSESKFVIETET